MIRKGLIYGLAGSFAIHGGLAISGHFLGGGHEHAAPKEEIPTIELAPIPQLDPEPPDVVETGDNAPSSEPADLAPPMQADTPSVAMDSPFVQQIQPPPPPGVNRPTGVMTIPAGRPATGGGGGGIGKIFDLASLDQKPVPTFQAPANFPMELKRAKVSGSVTVQFIIDSEGNPRDAIVVKSSHREFEPEALKAILKSKFRPGKKGGTAVSTRMEQTRVFTVPKS